MRAKLLASTVIAVIVLAACSSTEPSPADPEADAPTAAAATARGDGGSAETSTPGPSATGSADEPEPVELGADPYCGPAHDGYTAMSDLLDATDRASAETGVEDDGGDVAAMNAAGQDALAASARVRDAWTDARALLDSSGSPTTAGYSADDADEAFQGVLDHLDAWVDPEAEIAAQSSSIAEYDTAVLALLADEAAIEAASRGGEGLGVVLGYTVERCGDLPAL